MKKMDLVQSYILTTSRYHFTAPEKRILTQLVHVLQKYVKGQKLDKHHSVSPDLFGENGYRRINLPISACVKQEGDKNYELVKKSLLSLSNKTLEYDEGGRWESFKLVISPVLDHNSGIMQFDLHWRMYDAFLNYTKGFRKFEMLTMMQFESVYSMRFYELLSGQKTPINYTIDNLRLWLGLVDKYTQSRDFIKRTVDVAKKELDATSPYTFSYKVNLKGKKINSITFIPKYQPELRDPELEAKEAGEKEIKRIQFTALIKPNEQRYLIDNFDFETKHLDMYRGLFEQVRKIINEKERKCLIDWLAEVKTEMLKKEKVRTKIGYLVTSMRNKIKFAKGDAPKRQKRTQSGSSLIGDFLTDI